MMTMARNDPRGLAMRPGITAGSQRIQRPMGISVTIVPLPPTRVMDGDMAANFDDWLSESHAAAVVKLIRPLLIGDWRISPGDQWGRYVLRAPEWTDHFELIFVFRVDEMKIVVRRHVFPGATQPNGRFITVPIEHPHTIELLAQFVFEELREYKGREVVINQPILSATG